jgi:chromosome partitioning protein
VTEPDDGSNAAASELEPASSDPAPTGQAPLEGQLHDSGAVETSPTAAPLGPLPGADRLPPVAGETNPDIPATDPTAEPSADPGTTVSGPPTASDPPTVSGSTTPTADSAEPPPLAVRRELPRTLAIANQKGGVGKTTTAVNLGAALAELGYRVLVVDLDPQGNATTGLGINARNLDASVYDVILHDVPIEDTIEPTSLRNLFVVPATIDLAGAEIELVPVFSRELRVRRALEHVGDDFDFTLIDCPPSLGLLTVNGLAAASEVIVPIQCEYYALEGLGQLLRNVHLVQTNLNPELEMTTIVLTMYDARTRLAEQVVAEVRRHFGDRVCRNVVPRTVRLSEAPSFGQPIIVFDPSSRGAIAYRELAKEVSGGAPQRVG